MNIFDTHAHYDDEAFAEDRHNLITCLHEKGVKYIMNIGADLNGCKETIQLAKEYPFVYGSIGIHPEHISAMNEEIFKWLDETLKNEAKIGIDTTVQLSHREELQSESTAVGPRKILAVGEIGLDYHWYPEEKEQQIYWLRRQITLAKKYGLPVVIHSRDAAEDTFRVLLEEHAEEVGGVIHSYSGSAEMAKEYVKKGFFIGVGGVVTFKNGKKLRRVVEEIPLEHIVLETDCPYMSPEPYRGRRNHSGNLVYVAEEIARIKGVASEEVQKITLENGKRLYHMIP